MDRDSLRRRHNLVNFLLGAPALAGVAVALGLGLHSWWSAVGAAVAIVYGVAARWHWRLVEQEDERLRMRQEEEAQLARDADPTGWSQAIHDELEASRPVARAAR